MGTGISDDELVTVGIIGISYFDDLSHIETSALRNSNLVARIHIIAHKDIVGHRKAGGGSRHLETVIIGTCVVSENNRISHHGSSTIGNY